MQGTPQVFVAFRLQNGRTSGVKSRYRGIDSGFGILFSITAG